MKDLIAEELFEIVGDLTREVGAVVKHRQKDAGDFERVFEGLPNAADGIHQLRDTLESKELALDGNEDGVRGK